MNKEHITIKDIAEILHLHHTTVSRALRYHPDISEETKKKVHELATKLDYHPNVIAQNFKKKKSRTIGIIVPDFKNDFFARLISGIETDAYEAGYDILICQSDEQFEREKLKVGTLISNQVCGAVVCIAFNTKHGDHFQVFNNRNIPLAFCHRVCQDTGAIKIVSDNIGGSFKLTEHLIKNGRKNIGYLAAPLELPVFRQRYDGYINAMNQYNVPINKNLVIIGGVRKEDGKKGAMELLKNVDKIDAIYAVNDIVAVGAMIYLKERGIKIPEDIGIAGFGDNEAASLVDPALTTVRQNPIILGKMAVDKLIERIENPGPNISTETFVIDTQLITRKSA
jgi:DNA-binding LacI/PurR family transcriptional regulator